MTRHRIQQIKKQIAPCVVCSAIGDFSSKECSYIDHDLRGYICLEDAAAVIIAEEVLRDAGLDIPTDSLSGL